MDWMVKSTAELPAVAEEILTGKVENVLLFKGQMGAGKTTLIKAICSAFGVQDKVSSPTFSIVNQYQNNAGQQVYHFDFYRIEDEEEAYDFGYEEYFFSGQLCLVEWPEKISNLLPLKFGLIEVEEINEQRKITFQPSVMQLPA